MRAAVGFLKHSKAGQSPEKTSFHEQLLLLLISDSKFCVARFDGAGLQVGLRHAMRLGMRVFPSLMVSITSAFFGQVAIAETLELDRESFCANVDSLQLAQANLLGALAGHHMGIAIVEDASDSARERLQASIEQAISIARDLSESTQPFRDLCATN